MTVELNKKIASDIMSYVGESKAATNNIQQEIDKLAGPAAVRMITTLKDEGGDIKDILDKTLDSDIIQILTLFIDKAPSKRVRDDSVSDLVKRINRCFKKQVDKVAAELGTMNQSGKLAYPSLGRSIKENTPETKWDVKEIEFSPRKDKEGNAIGADIKSVSGSKSNNSGKPKELDEVAQIAKTPEQIAQAVALTVAIHGLSWDDVMQELTKVAVLSKGTKIQFKREANAAPSTNEEKVA